MKFKLIFSEFVFGKKRSENIADHHPSTVKEWTTHMISEYLGTILLTLAFAGPAIQLANGQPVVEYMGNKLFLALYGIISIAVILILFLRWSCDLNPAVTITRMLNGKNTFAYGVSKIAIQFIAGFTTAGIFIAISKGDHAYEHFAFNAQQANLFGAWTLNGAVLGSYGTFFWDLFVECFMIIILLWAIFSKSFSDKYRDILISFAIGIAILAGLDGGSIALNPARGLAQQLPALLMGESNIGIDLTTAAILVSMIAPFVFLTLQGMFSQWFIPAFAKGIAWKNPNMILKQDEEPRQTIGEQINPKH